ncbi:MAG: Hint domain-containing protein, partial [Sulfitobacter sp.]|nr:Hint domain-containing protein [Sulfitobacter sp.]
TVDAGDGNDTVEGDDGDDFIETGNGDLAPDLGYPFAATDPLGYDPDTDPENDRDFVDGGAGDDTISTGDDRDTVFGGDGADVIDGGIDDDDLYGEADDDRIVGGEGNDSIFGGDGNDAIYAGNDPELGLDALSLPDEADPDFPFSPDRQPLNGRDTVDGGAGNDTIFGADDDDLLLGGSGDDYIDGEVDDDTIDGNTGDDTLLGGKGDDSVEGGQGDDVIEGGEGDDTLRGNRDDDIIRGGDGNDSIDGGGENDTLYGGDGDDSITGNQGDDSIEGGLGADTLSGGAGQDTFEDVNAGDVIDGGSGPVDFDTLFLAGSAPEGGRFEITYTSDDREDGFVDYFNADDSDAGRLTFVEIENVVPCFTPGTKIATPKGEVLVEDLQVGDRVITRDNGMQEIRWVGKREMTGAELEAAAHLKPVLIQKGALGNDLPERDMMVSPQHRVLIANDKTALYFEEREVLVAAKHLTDREGIDVVDVSGTTYIHIMFDQHEVVLSDGAWTESFQPGDMTLAGIGDAQRQEILELFPELETQEGIENYSAARRSLKKFEAKLQKD